jgi:mono/diheme cytochrome c family protein
LKSIPVLAVFASLIPAAVMAQDVGNPNAGLTFARNHCAECHAIRGSEDNSPNKDAPPFASVAKTPGMNGRALAAWLQTSHPTMPDFLIAQEDRDNVIAYILSLQPPQEH